MGGPLKALLGILVYALTFFVVIGAIGLFWAFQEFQKPGPLQEALLFEVQQGQGLAVISHNLEQKGAIENHLLFQAIGRIQNAQSELKAGEYELTVGISAQKILSKIREGETFRRAVTIPEGLTSFEIVQRLLTEQDLSGEIQSIPPEGSLLPETYDHRKDEPRERLIGRMQKAMIDTIEDLWPERAENLPISTKEEAIILASIIEKETGKPEERRRVAGVFVNRLRKGMPLQTDPTVIYAITMGKNENDGMGPLGRRLLRKDMEIDSPYNTYKHPGLTPGPIANPGRESIAAALNPENHDFLYFVADGTGGHIFAKTLDEHNRNAAEWRKIRK